MNWDQIQGKWKELKGQAQQQWGELTNDDIDQIDGNREELEGKIQTKYGKSKEEVREEVNQWLDRM